LVPFEEGGYSRISFHPGFEHTKERNLWESIEFPFGGEDNGAGDLDMDGHIDLVINGGQVLFNRGPKKARQALAWTQMTLFKNKLA
jgi:hypothetical protein